MVPDLSKRPLWMCWRVNGDAIVTALANDRVDIDKDGFVICEYPVNVEETAVPDPAGKMQIAFKVGPLSSMVNIASVSMFITGYTRCESTALIEIWEKVRSSIQQAHSNIITPKPGPGLGLVR